MIELTKINGDPIVLNCRLIESIVLIPETKIIMENGKYHLVTEDVKTIIQKVTAFEQNIAAGIGDHSVQLTRKVRCAAGELEEETSWLTDSYETRDRNGGLWSRKNLEGNGREV